MPGDLKEVREAIERECQAYYLDGPNGVDWIFRNDIKRAREEALYVDYVEYEGGHQWVSPKSHEEIAARFFFGKPVAIRLIGALHATGFAQPKALALIAQAWRLKRFTDETDHADLAAAIGETLTLMQRAGLLKSVGDDTYSYILDRWPFPLYAFPMRVNKVNKQSLIDIRGRRFPDS